MPRRWIDKRVWSIGRIIRKTAPAAGQTTPFCGQNAQMELMKEILPVVIATVLCLVSANSFRYHMS